jgi:LPXTG-site transpeptidase (sortase) family protein
MALNNPLFEPKEDNADKKSGGFVLNKNEKVIKPTPEQQQRHAAADIARDKLEKLYAKEPSAQKELGELDDAAKPFSKHQQKLLDIQKQAKSVADIQVEWHKYYASLSEHDKHEVWQEFYAEQSQHSRYAQFTKQADTHAEVKAVVSHHEVATPTAAHKRIRDSRSAREIKHSVKQKVRESAIVQDKHHPLRSLFFGIGIGGVVLLVLLFGLFNQLVIAPFIQPNKNVSATPIILDNNAIAADGSTKVVIPKINVEIPVDYNVASMAEKDIQAGLENGVVHYPTTVRPGEQGNAAFFGHSSNNIFNPGKYKFAFVLLNNLQPGDMFYLTYNKQVYAYKVYEKKIVNPDQVEILNPVAGKTATAALITCDPPGTTLHRLVVWGEQVSPEPSSNTVAINANQGAGQAETSLTGAPPSVWKRFTNWLF